MTRVVLTGAGGFIGTAVASHLVGLPGLTVLAGSRAGLPVAGAQGVRLDVLDRSSLGSALSGAQAVVHCAVGDHDVTTRGTRLLHDAAIAAGVCRLVHFSSIAVYGTASGSVDETMSLPPAAARVGTYGQWKIETEQMLAASPIEVVRLRPTIVYGAGSRIWVRDLARRIRSGRWGTFGTAADGTCNLVHVTDVARAVAAALTMPAAGGEAFNIDGGSPMTWNAWFARMAAAIGAPALASLPPQTLHRRSRLSLPGKAIGRLAPGLLPGFAQTWLQAAPSASEVTLYGLAATYPAAKARAILGWSPEIGLEQGLADCAAWLRSQGLAA